MCFSSLRRLVLALVQSVLLALVAFHGKPGSDTIGQILALSLLQGGINAFDMPARQSLVADWVQQADGSYRMDYDFILPKIGAK